MMLCHSNSIRALLCVLFVSSCLCGLLIVAEGCAPRGAADPQPYAVGLVRAEGRAGAHLTVRPGTVVILDGRESGFSGGGADAMGTDRLIWRWRQVSGPGVRLARADLSSIECRPVAEGLHIFELVVSSGSRRSLPVLVEVEVRRDAPAHPDDAVTTSGGDGEPLVRRPSGPTAEFALLESDLGELVRVFPAKTGITLRADPEWLRPEAFGERPLTFMAREVTPDVALELAARLAGASFVRDGKNSARLTAGLGWLRSLRQEARFYPAPAGLVPPDGDAAELKGLLRESCRAATFACPDASVQWQPGLSGVNVVGPESLHRRVRETMSALAAIDIAPPAAPPETEDEKLRDAVLSTPVRLRLVDAELSRTALELGGTLGVPVAWEESAGKGRGAMPRVSFEGRGRSAAEILAEIEKQAGFEGHSWVAGGALWLHRTGPRAGSAESAWTRAVARAYPAKWLEKRGILPGAFILAARKRVRPETWTDPATLIAFYKDTGKILVIASPEAQDEVVRLMHALVRKNAE